MAILDNVVEKIIKEQELVIGPLAWTEAGKVQGIHIDKEHGAATVDAGDPKSAVDDLVARYERLFGRASHEVCKEAAASLISALPHDQIPASLLAA